MEEIRDVVMHFRVTPTEEKQIRQKMEEVGVHSLSAYLRKMAMNGYCIKLDYEQPRRINTLLRRCSNNLNQYAKKANETGSIYAADIQDLKERLDELWDLQKESLRILSAIK